MNIKPINKKYLARINRAYKYYRLYFVHVDLDGTFDSDREERTNERKQAKAFESYLEIFEELPKRERESFERQHNKLHGYK